MPTPPSSPRTGAAGASVLLAVYAPLAVLRGAFPAELGDSAARRLVEHLRQVAACGVHVAALIDTAEGETHFVRITGGTPAQPELIGRGKMTMDHPATLTHFLCEAHRAFPGAATVLALEGRGGGFVPEVDRHALAAPPAAPAAVRWVGGSGYWMPVREDGSALIERGAPIHVGASPNVPLAGLPMSTPALGRALSAAAAAGVPKLAVLLLDGSFGMSVEVLHTVMPFAEHAVGYPNHNFFSAGATFPLALCGMEVGGPQAAGSIAARLADANHALLGADGRHPTVGCTIRLARMRQVVECIDHLADALLAALRLSPRRPAMIGAIRHAIVLAQQYDTEASLDLQGNVDELVDIAGLAATLSGSGAFAPAAVAPAAQELQRALAGIKHYGDSGVPWFLPDVRWDFSYSPHAMNIFLPDPMLQGRWDWRSPYYLDPADGSMTEFQRSTDWIDFIVEYHREVPFHGLLPAALPPLLHQRHDAADPRGADRDQNVSRA